MSKNSSNSSNENGEIGNTKQISPAIRWCFTVHNYDKNDINDLNSSFSSNSSKFIIFSEEKGKSGETEHLQGYIEFNKKCRPKNMFKNNTIHWEKSKGNRQQNIDYIKKEGGKHYINGKLIKPLNLINNLYDWQKIIVNKSQEEPDDRTINWIHEPDGNKGKSALCKLLCAKYGALLLSNKAGDMKYGIMKYFEKHNKYPEIILIDIPRSVDLHFLSYTGIEEIKNGCFFNTKYECDMVLFNSPHIFIFSNELPDIGQLSRDRWNIINL